MAELLPPGAYVLVTRPGPDAPPPFYAVVRGYSIHRDKYLVSYVLAGLFDWFVSGFVDYEFVAWCTEATEREAFHRPECDHDDGELPSVLRCVPCKERAEGIGS